MLQPLNDYSMGLYKAAHLYQIEQLKEICEKEMLLKVTSLNAVNIYEVANLYELKELKEKSWTIIKT